MDTTFNFNRFWKVMCNEWRLTRKTVATFWGGLVGFTFGVLFGATYLLSLISGGEFGLLWRDIILGLLFLVLLLAQGLYLQFYFREFSSKTKTQALFLLPVSQNETFWAKFSLGAILYLLIGIVYMTAVVLISGVLNVWIWDSGLSELHPKEYFTLRQELSFFTGTFWDTMTFISAWLLFAGGFLFGLFLFKKNAVLKSFSLWIVAIAVLGFFICTVYFLFTGTFPNFATLGHVWFGGSNSVCLITKYPRLWVGIYAFIGAALIAICRVKYNEKTI